MSDTQIERRIITGLIVSTDYTRQIRRIWNSQLLESSTARKLANWCIDYFDKYDRAPGRDIETMFYDKTKNLPQEEAEDIEDILDGLSDEYTREDKFNVPYLLDQTHQYFDERNLLDFTQTIQLHIQKGRLTKARELAVEYQPIAQNVGNEFDFSNPQILEEVEKAFSQAVEPIVHYPRQLGKFWNRQLVRDAFIGLMAPEKRGKTFWLMDFAIRSARQKANVALFQVGDMSTPQQIRRGGIYLTKKSDLAEYSGKMYQPVRDCVWNQMDLCNRKERECDHGVFPPDEGQESSMYKEIRYNITKDDLVEKYKENPEYIPCYNCPLYWQKENKWGTTWLQEVDTGDPLTASEAQKAYTKFFINKKRHFKLVTYPTDTCTISEIKSRLTIWEKQEQFVPDVIVIDYADILAPEISGDPRDQENDKWKKLRGLSQERHCLVITATQTDTDSYNKDRITRKNFSEDKRKLGHVTAMYGLNQDKDWREKELGIMRINKVALREGDYKETDEVYVLQNLFRGQPCLGSYW